MSRIAGGRHSAPLCTFCVAGGLGGAGRGRVGGGDVMKIKLTARLRTADSPGHELRWPSRCWQQSVLQRSGTIKIVQCFTIFLNSLNIPTLILELNLLLFLQHLGGEMEC